MENNLHQNNLYQEFGPRLAELRQRQGLSQRALAERLSVTRQAVSNWERGTTTPDISTLYRIGEVLGVDWNELMGSAPPPPRRRAPARQAIALSLAGALAGAALVGALWAGSGLPGAQTPEETVSSQPPEAGTPLAMQTRTLIKYDPYYEHKAAEATLAETREATPDSPLRQSAARLSQLLNTITQTGEIELTPGAELTLELRNAFSAAGEDCLFRFLPSYENGVFTDPNMVLTWLYRSGHSRGAAFTTGQVDAWLAAWFGPDVQWTHASTEDYPLHDGVYIPHSCWTAVHGYDLERLVHREDGSFWAEITCGTSSKVIPRTLTIIFTAEESGPQFSYVGWSKEPTP